MNGSTDHAPGEPGMNTAAPLVSVLIPAYNHEQFVAKALDSVLRETYPALELVVCDDGSGDDTASVVGDWIRDHPDVSARLLMHRNEGVGRTLNRLLGEARGRYVALLASDDELLPGGIAARLRVMTGPTRAVFGDAMGINAAGEITQRSCLEAYHMNRRRLHSDLATEIILNWGVPGPVLLAEADALLALGGFSEDIIVEDWDMYLRLAARGWLRFVDVSVARYRIHGGGVSWRRENSKRMIADQQMVASRNLPLFRGRHRLMLSFQRLVYTQPWRVPMRLISKALRTADRIVR